ncbi:hypothetical protein CI102_12185 [Trichoderma harzianum]|nr:hypothetical protein CI102_12185 [Trichoderma harzianum]
MYMYSRQSIKNGHSSLPFLSSYTTYTTHYTTHYTTLHMPWQLSPICPIMPELPLEPVSHLSLLLPHLLTNCQNEKRRQVCVCTTGTAREKPEQRATWVSFTSTGCSLAPLSLVVLWRGQHSRDMEGKLWRPGRAFPSPCLAGCRRPDTVPRIMLQIRWPGSFTAQYKTHASPAIGMFSYAPENSVLSLLARKPICNLELTYKSPSPSFRIYVPFRCPAYLHTCTGYRLTG